MATKNKEQKSKDYTVDTKENLGQYYADITMPGGYSFSTHNTLQKIFAYYDGYFLKGDKDNLGIRKDFFQIIKPTVDLATKFIDLDTGNIMFRSEEGLHAERVWLMNKEFRYWVKNSDFATLLNEIGDEYPRSHVWIKKVNNKWEKVPPTNMRFKANAKNADNSPFLYEVIEFSRSYLVKMKDKWNQPGELEKLLEENPNAKTFLGYDCYDKNNDGGYDWTIRITKPLNDKNNAEANRSAESLFIDGKGNEEIPVCVVHKATVKKHPYRELVWERKDGRLLAFAYPEYLFANQMRRNEVKHLEKLALYLKALQIFVSNDDTIGQNAITNVKIGQILKTSGRLEKVRMDNVDLSAYNNENTDWDNNTTKKTFDTPIARGDSLPSQTPLGLGELQAQMTASFFERKRENFAIFVKKLLYEDILPDFKKDRRSRHSLMIESNDKDFAKFARIMAKNLVDKQLKTLKDSGQVIPGKNIIETEKARIEEDLLSRNHIEINIPEGYYDEQEIKMTIEIVITGESSNTQNKYQGLQLALQTMASNPTILANEGTRQIFFKVLELMGIPAMDLGLLDETVRASAANLLTMGQTGGSAPAQAPANNGGNQSMPIENNANQI